MDSSKKKDLGLAVLAAILAAAAGLLPLAYHYGMRHPVRQATSVAGGPPPAAPAAETGAEPQVAAPPVAVPPPPAAEEVPAEESETDRGPTSASPAGPTLSFARAAGLHHTPDPMRLNSAVALVMDQDTGQVLARKNDDVVLPVASLTKIMTALVVLEAGQPMDEMLTITQDDVDTQRNSRSRLRVGTTLTREEALHVALMSSENRAAHALGRYYPGGLQKLVDTMNARARELGMMNTSYVDPTGLSNRNQSTAQDTALLVRAAARHPLIRDFSTTRAHVASLGDRTLQYQNSNRLVRNGNGWDIALQKTGYIVEAGRCLTMLTRVAGRNLIMVLLDADSNGERLADAQRLRRWVVAQNGWQDDVMLASARADRPRKAAAAGKSAPGKSQQAAAKKQRKGDTAVAKKGSAGRKLQVAAAKKDGQGEQRKGARADAVAKKSEPSGGKEGRVRQTFAGARDSEKS